MKKSIVEERICSPDFPYLKPWFYNNPYALRCELGIGDTDEAYMRNARKRAFEIYHILFPNGADAIFFDRWIDDYCTNGRPMGEDWENPDEIIESTVEYEMRRLRFLLEYEYRYRHMTLRNLQTYDEPGDEDFDAVRRNRVVCFSDGIGFDYEKLIDQQLDGSYDVSFVSFEHECIFSVYDDRGCGVVFMTREKMKEFYHRLQPYFLEYDREEMAKRYGS